MPRPAVLAVSVVAALLLATGCSLGPDAFNENLPDDQADAPGQLVVRTPEVVAPDLPYETPGLVEPLPGPTGGVPGDVPTEAAPASPGEGNRAELDQE